jgi:hypothetical protein
VQWYATAPTAKVSVMQQQSPAKGTPRKINALQSE